MERIPLGDIVKKGPFFDVVHTTGQAQAAVMTLKEGEASGPDLNRHPTQEQWLYVLEGEGVVRTDAGETPVAAGDLVVIAPDEPHRVVCTRGTLRTLDWYAPPAY